jgi:hypothetical protein
MVPSEYENTPNKMLVAIAFGGRQLAQLLAMGVFPAHRG